MAAPAKAHVPAGSRARSGRLRVRGGAKGGDPNGPLNRRLCEHPPGGCPVDVHGGADRESEGLSGAAGVVPGLFFAGTMTAA
jgi:hypothetical protein